MIRITFWGLAIATVLMSGASAQNKMVYGAGRGVVGRPENREPKEAKIDTRLAVKADGWSMGSHFLGL
jgi:hypothetical protein